MQGAIQVLHNAKVTECLKSSQNVLWLDILSAWHGVTLFIFFSKETVNMLYNVYTIECKFYFISTPQAPGA